MKRIALLACIALSACTQPNHATHVLHQAGYKNVTITGYNWLACSKDDTYHTGFTATGPSGMAVSGTVCSGLFFKGSTIRLD